MNKISGARQLICPVLCQNISFLPPLFLAIGYLFIRRIQTPGGSKDNINKLLITNNKLLINYQ